jgi:ribonuclease J
VSGHPRQAELEEMISWVRPQILVPVHGEPLHLTEHASLARRVGVGRVMTCRNGDLVKLAPEGPAIIDEVPAGRLRLAISGIVSIAMAITERGELVGEPEIETTGIPDKDADGNLIAEAACEAVLNALDSMPRARRRDPDAVAEAARRAVRAAVGSAWSKKPMVHVHVLTV